MDVLEAIWVEIWLLGLVTTTIGVDNLEEDPCAFPFVTLYLGRYSSSSLLAASTSQLPVSVATCVLQNHYIILLAIIMWLFLLTFKSSHANTYIGSLLFFPAMAEAVI